MKFLSVLILMTFVGCGPAVSKKKKGADGNNGSSNNGANNGVNNGSNNGSNKGSNNGSNNGSTKGSNNGTTARFCLNVSPASIAFGTADIGQRVERKIVLSNCGDELLDISASTSSPFSVQNSEILLEAGENIDLPIFFEPSEEGLASSAVTVVAEDLSFDVQVTGTGQLEPETCPIAFAVGNDGAGNIGNAITVEVGSEFTLDGARSQAVNGQIDSFQWSGGTGIVIDDPSSSLTTARALRVGMHSIDLVVTDTLGESSCMPAVVVVTAIDKPVTGLDIVLIWDTPADPDQTDINGTDLDLHFLHPNGSWNLAPWDCFWKNTAPEWGSNSLLDNPRYLLEDTDGMGPEQIFIDEFERVVYNLGVFYYADKGFGPSYATLQIKLNGMLISEQKDVFLQSTNKFWLAGTFDGATNIYTPSTVISDGFPP